MEEEEELEGVVVVLVGVVELEDDEAESVGYRLHLEGGCKEAEEAGRL